jgi:hypothetical protein
MVVESNGLLPTAPFSFHGLGSGQLSVFVRCKAQAAHIKFATAPSSDTARRTRDGAMLFLGEHGSLHFVNYWTTLERKSVRFRTVSV